jgi:Ca-activated chloride channel family protein
MRFAYPWVLWFLALLPALGYIVFRLDRRKRGTLRFSDVTHLKHVPRSLGMRLRVIVPILRIVVLGLLIVGLARPQSGWREQEVTAEGIDIMLALDVSNSMQAQDFTPNRLEAAKKVVGEFIDGRKKENDRIGCVIFAATNFTLCPMTLDYGVLKDFLKRVDFNIINGTRTAIGMGLANGIRQLKESKARSKIIILLTDGSNNAGRIDPFTAAEMAKALHIKVYTIGVGSESRALMPGGLFGGLRVAPAEYDEKTLRRIADITEGQFFKANNERKLAEIYSAIDAMEKTESKSLEYKYYDELMEWAVLPALALFLLEIGLGYTRFRKLP